MILSSIKEVYIAQHAIDFRKGPNGLLAESYAMELDPYKGETVVFVHRSRRMIKVLGGDEFGVWVLLRRFEGGALREQFPFLEEKSFVQTTQAQLAMLLEGATFEVTSKVKTWKKPLCGLEKQEAFLLPACSHENEQDVRQKEVTSPRSRRGLQQGPRLGQEGSVRT